MKTLKYIILMVVLLSCKIASAGVHEVLISPAFGGSSIGGLIIGGELEEVMNKFYISECIYYSEEIALFGPLPKKNNFSTAINIGRNLFDINNFSGKIGIGLGYIQGINRGKLVEEYLLSNQHERINFKSICFPIEFSILKHFRYFGFGGRIIGNLNYYQSFVGVLFSFSIGRFVDIK